MTEIIVVLLEKNKRIIRVWFIHKYVDFEVFEWPPIEKMCGLKT